MTQIIQRNLIRHLEWQPGQEVPTTPEPTVPIIPVQGSVEFNVEDLINHGKEFYADKVAGSLRDVQEYVKEEGGLIYTIPQLIAGKATAPKSNYLWKNWHTGNTEEYVLIDSEGTFGETNQPIVITLHGGGIFSTHERIQQAYDHKEGLVNGAGRLTDEEINRLLVDGIVDDSGTKVQFFRLEDFLNNGVQDISLRCGIVSPLETLKATTSGYHKKDVFMSNPSVKARALVPDYLDGFFDKAKDSDEEVCNYHPFDDIDPSVGVGRVLWVSNVSSGLSGNGNLGSLGRFVGYAPEAPHVARE